MVCQRDFRRVSLLYDCCQENTLDLLLYAHDKAFHGKKHFDDAWMCQPACSHVRPLGLREMRRLIPTRSSISGVKTSEL